MKTLQAAIAAAATLLTVASAQAMPAAAPSSVDTLRAPVENVAIVTRTVTRRGPFGGVVRRTIVRRRPVVVTRTIVR